MPPVRMGLLHTARISCWRRFDRKNFASLSPDRADGYQEQWTGSHSYLQGWIHQNKDGKTLPDPHRRKTPASRYPMVVNENSDRTGTTEIASANLLSAVHRKYGLVLAEIQQLVRYLDRELAGRRPLRRDAVGNGLNVLESAEASELYPNAAKLSITRSNDK